MYGSPRGLRGWQRGHRPSEPDPGNAGGGNGLTEKRDFDAVFVGGGAIGLSAAWRAAQRGARVAVVERAEPAAGATGVAAGMLAPVGELTFGEPELTEMCLASAQLYPEFVAELEAASGVPTGYSRLGALHIALDRDEAAELRRVHDLQRSLGLAAEWLPPRRCRELEPGLTPSFNGGVHAPQEAVVDPRALSGALVGALAGAGAEVRSGERGRRRPVRGRAAERGCAPRRAWSCARPRSCSPAAPGRAAPSGCPRTPVRRCARSRDRCWSCGARRRRALRADPRLRAGLPGAARRRAADRRAPPRKSAASTRRSSPAESTSCCARATACSPTSPRWSWSRRSPGCGRGRRTTCR